MRIAFVAGIVLFLAGCQTTVQTQSRFDATEAAFIKTEGSGVITGHGFLKRRTGNNVNAGGEIVRLTPVTAYSRERFEKLYHGKKFIAALSMPKVDVDPVYASYTRTVKADHMGRFRFENVAAGSYYVSTQTIWRDRGEFTPRGGAMYDIVTITGKETGPVDVILSGN